MKKLASGVRRPWQGCQRRTELTTEAGQASGGCEDRQGRRFRFCVHGTYTEKKKGGSQEPGPERRGEEPSRNFFPWLEGLPPVI
jgi:hypothetical protein